MRVFLLWIDSIGGGQFYDTAFADEVVAQLRAADLTEEWKNAHGRARLAKFIPRCVEGERLSNGRCLVDNRAYTLDNGSRRVSQARISQAYNERTGSFGIITGRIMNSKIVLAILGHGTCGKTTSARWLASVYGLCYKYSTSEFAKITIELSGDKFENRVAWGQAIADFNNQDGGIKLYKLMAKDHNIFDGIRRINELDGVRQWVLAKEKIFVPVWIDRDVPKDPSCEIRPEHCRFSVNNRGELVDLYTNLDFLWKGIREFQD